MSGIPKRPRFQNRLNILLIGVAMLAGTFWLFDITGLAGDGRWGLVMERTKTHPPGDVTWAKRLASSPLDRTKVSWLGFAYDHEPRGNWSMTLTSATTLGPWRFEGTEEVWSVQIPYWFLLALPLGLVAARWPGHRRRLRQWRWAQEGRCGTCGYDLRGSPGRCPECGTEREGSGPQA